MLCPLDASGCLHVLCLCYCVTNAKLLRVEKCFESLLLGIAILLFTGSISGSGLFLYLNFLVATRMGDDAELPGSEAAKDHFVWQYFTVTYNDPKKGGAKNAL